jgi:hypothetical protein
MPIQKLQRKVNKILLITMQKEGRWYISNRSKIWKLLIPTTKIVHNDTIHSSHTDEYYINLPEWDAMQSGKYVPVLSYCNRGQQHLVVCWPTKPLTSRLLVCKCLRKRQTARCFQNTDWDRTEYLRNTYVAYKTSIQPEAYRRVRARQCSVYSGVTSVDNSWKGDGNCRTA